MRTVLFAAVLAMTVAAFAAADSNGGHAYKKAASVQDLMEYMVKPAMEKVKAFREAGGPSDKDEWQTAFGAVSMVNEACQLVLMDGRVKDDAWQEGAAKVVAGSRDAMLGAFRMNAEGYNAAVKAMSAGCKTCHDVHKKKE